MARKSKAKIIQHEVLPVEVVLWHDAAGHERETPTTTSVALRSVGFVVAQTDTELILAYDLEAKDGWMSDNAITTNIPLMNILERKQLGEVQIEMDPDIWHQYSERVQAFLSARGEHDPSQSNPPEKL